MNKKFLFFLYIFLQKKKIQVILTLHNSKSKCDRQK